MDGAPRGEIQLGGERSKRMDSRVGKSVFDSSRHKLNYKATQLIFCRLGRNIVEKCFDLTM
jgi:hypothetical protein